MSPSNKQAQPRTLTGRWTALGQGLLWLLPSLALLLLPLLWLDSNQLNGYGWLPMFGVPVLLFNWLIYPENLNRYEQLRPAVLVRALAARRPGARLLDGLLRLLLFLLALWLAPLLWLLTRRYRRKEKP